MLKNRLKSASQPFSSILGKNWVFLCKSCKWAVKSANRTRKIWFILLNIIFSCCEICEIPEKDIFLEECSSSTSVNVNKQICRILGCELLRELYHVPLGAVLITACCIIPETNMIDPTALVTNVPHRRAGRICFDTFSSHRFGTTWKIWFSTKFHSTSHWFWWTHVLRSKGRSPFNW